MNYRIIIVEREKVDESRIWVEVSSYRSERINPF